MIRCKIEKNLGGISMSVLIRRAREKDIPDLHRMLLAIAAFHAEARPDIFKTGQSKYTPEDLQLLLQDDTYRIFVAEAPDGVCGYVFGILQETKDHLLLQDRKELYVDDLYVDANKRKGGIATLLMQQAKQEAQANGCCCVTLNVWNLPASALAFYEKLGYTERKRYMELEI